MKRAIPILAIFLLVIACKTELVEKPEDLIAKDKMTEILYDLSIMYASKGVSVGQLDFDRLSIDNFIYEQYGVDSTQVANSTIYYSSKPNVYLGMYEEIEQRLKAGKDTIIERRKSIKNNDSTSIKDKIKVDSLERERKLREFIDTKN
ncbi:DUF4296 domain-containing protein [Ascidiimonas sp. W6]|uniref:DUF4296 domain-containing protein n=1 Tax=Ascidiimonas meishanensis TaxID=3128903 RepID=UPI0030EC0446